MMKKTAKQAVGVGIGCTLGGTVLPRLLLAQNYNSTWPPLWQHAIIGFVACYGASFAVFLLINWVKAKWGTKKDSEEQPPVWTDPG